MLDQAKRDPSQIRKSLAAGFKPTLIKSGDETLKYWDYTIETAEVIGILLCIYVVLLIISYLAMRYLHRLKR